MDKEELFLRKLRKLNKGHAIIDSVDCQFLKKDGHGLLIVRWHKTKENFHSQLYINSIYTKSILLGKQNKNLESILRL